MGGGWLVNQVEVRCATACTVLEFTHDLDDCPTWDRSVVNGGCNPESSTLKNSFPRSLVLRCLICFPIKRELETTLHLQLSLKYYQFI